MLFRSDFTVELAEKLEPQCDEDDIPEQVEAKTKRGDIYKLAMQRAPIDVDPLPPAIGEQPSWEDSNEQD